MDLSKSYDFFQPEKDDSPIHIVGCGSVGSTVAENLARCGLKKFVLWDFDHVEPHNLANQMFTTRDIGQLKVDAVKNIICEINPDAADSIKTEAKGWNGQKLTGYIFLCVDSIEIRKQIVEAHMNSPFVKAVFDFRARLEDAQHYAADWSDFKMKQDLLASMDFTHEEAAEETPMSACHVTLSVCPTVRVICALGVANFMNFWNGKPIKKLILADSFNFCLDAF